MIRPFKISELTSVLAATLIGSDVVVSGVSTDTRNIKKGDLFVALKGHNFNGHKFLAKAKAAGAVAAIVDEPVKSHSESLPLLNVSDALLALGQIAAWNRNQFTGLVTAVTGSAGKTSVKSMMADVLSIKGPVLATQGNFNNHIGAPLTLLNLTQDYQAAVIELGASAQGEIDYTAQLARPAIAVITNVSGVHLEGFGNIETIMQTKGELIDALASDGVIVLNRDDQFYSNWLKRAGNKKVISFGQHNDADVKATNINCHEQGCQFDLCVEDSVKAIRLPLLGEHNVMNALATSAVGIAAGISLQDIAIKLGQLSAVPGRMQWRQTDSGIEVLDDSYNASPASVKAAIDVIKIWQDKAWLVLGDMGELGTEAKSIHEEIGEYARQSGITKLVAVGRHTNSLVESFGAGGHWFSCQSDLIKYLQEHMQLDQVVLVKGSRSTAMDKVVEAIISMPAEAIKAPINGDD